jgi:SAM-dependent methyltransferase
MRALDRILTPELLDSLDPTDPRAIRSRRDLVFIDAFMGNSRWIRDSVARSSFSGDGVVELGAGDGRLCERFYQVLHDAEITGLDLIPRPQNLSAGIRWVPGDFFKSLDSVRAGVCAGSLVLHHFPDEALRELGRRLARFSFLVFAEPLRSPLPLAASALVFPLVGEVTRHDMPASIRAGFLPGEIAEALHLDPKLWTIREVTTLTGSLRFTASKRRP